jgi:hypothetical protein
MAITHTRLLNEPIALELQPLSRSRQGVTEQECYRPHTSPKVPSILGRLLCKLGIHDFRMINRTFGFGTGGGIETVECLRCGITIIRQA